MPWLIVPVILWAFGMVFFVPGPEPFGLDPKNHADLLTWGLLWMVPLGLILLEIVWLVAAKTFGLWPH